MSPALAGRFLTTSLPPILDAPHLGQPGSLTPASSFFFKFYLFIYFWLCWVFVSARGLSPVAASGGHSSSRCAGLSLSRPLLLWSTGSRRAGSVVVVHGPSCSAACGIFPDQCSNPCPLHWQADSQPLRHQGSPPPASSVTPFFACWSPGMRSSKLPGGTYNFRFSKTITVSSGSSVLPLPSGN